MDPRRMPIGEHLQELRVRLLRGIGYLVLGSSICLLFQDTLMDVVTWPHVRTMEAIRQAAEVDRLDRAGVPPDEGEEILGTEDRLRAADEVLRADLARRGGLATPGRLAALASEQEGLRRDQEALSERIATAPAEELPTLVARADDLHRRLADLDQAIDREIRGALPPGPAPPPARLQVLNYSEAFLAYLKVAIVCGLLLTFPLIGWEIWRFVAAGLYPKEQRWVTVIAPVSGVFFILGVLFGYFILIPIGLRYLASYGDPSLVQTAVTLDQYLYTFALLTLAVGLIFQLPLVLAFGAMIRVWDAARLSRFRKYFVLVASIVAAVLTPPDVVSQILLAIPLLVLYEIGILGVRIVERVRRQAAAGLPAGPVAPPAAPASGPPPPPSPRG